ncbi:MAG: peptidoglycan-binding domain-containing protein [Minisyncoccia bacterium]
MTASSSIKKTNRLKLSGFVGVFLLIFVFGIAYDYSLVTVKNVYAQEQQPDNNNNHKLAVRKVVVGSDADPSVFSFSVNGGDAIPFESDGLNKLFLTENINTIVESPIPDNYTVTYDNCTNVLTDGWGQEGYVPPTCTITNTFVPPTPTPQTATIIAEKIVCPTEDLLPNWGNSGPDITSTTASAFIAAHPSCHLEPWTFEWSPNISDLYFSNPGDHVGVAGGVWTPFTSSVTVPSGARLWVREQFNDDYIHFTGDNTTQNVSAELYCSNDVVHYDNYDYVDPVVAGQTYHCVGFNVLKVTPPAPPQCDDGIDNDGDGFIDYPADPGCTSPDDNTESPNPTVPPTTATISAKKIVCDSESELPNWGLGGPNITSTTTSTFLNTHPNCHLESWTFEWATSTAANPGNQVGDANGWTSFTSTTTVPAGARIWVREQFNNDYISFNGDGNTSNISAELYCHTDVLNYDNYDFIDPVVVGQTYHCVGFNVLKVTPPTPPQCDDGIDNDGDGFIDYPADPGCTSEDDNTESPNPGNPPALTVSLSANPTSITQGASSTLSWTSTNTNICNAGWTTATSTSGTQSVSPTATTTYSITCGNGNATSTATTTVNVVVSPPSPPQCDDGIDNDGDGFIDHPADPGCTNEDDNTEAPNPGNPPTPPTVSVSLSANPTSVTQGQSSLLSWNSTNTNICNATWTTATSTLGTQSVTPATTTAYSITCGNGNATSTATTTVTVTIPNGPTPVTVSLSANPTSITVGNSSLLSWTSNNTNICGATWTVATSTSGTQSVSPTVTTDYSITCGNGTASSTATTTISVTPVTTGGGGGGGGGSSRSGGSSRPAGTVLGATTVPTECFYLRDYLRIDFNNDPVEVFKLQSFLRNFEGHNNLAMTGVFDQATLNAVNQFQMKYFGDILEPWGHTGPTGYVYILTKKKINEIYCQRVFPLTQAQLNEIVAFRAFLQGLQSQGIDVSLPPAPPVIPSTPIVPTVSMPEVGEAEEESHDEGQVLGLAGAIFAMPDNLLDTAKCLYEWILILVVLYVLGNVLKNVFYKDLPENNRKRFLTKWVTMDVGITLAIIVAYLMEWWCVILPLLVALILSLIWTLTYSNHNSVRASAKSWYLVSSARLKTILRRESDKKTVDTILKELESSKASLPVVEPKK